LLAKKLPPQSAEIHGTSCKACRMKLSITFRTEKLNELWVYMI